MKQSKVKIIKRIQQNITWIKEDSTALRKFKARKRSTHPETVGTRPDGAHIFHNQ